MPEEERSIPFKDEARKASQKALSSSAPREARITFQMHYGTTRDALSEGKTVSAIDEIGGTLLHTTGVHLQKINAEDDMVDCQKGCFYCCFLNVDMSIPEVIHLCLWLNGTKTQDELDAILDKARAKYNTTREMTKSERIQHSEACPLLSPIQKSRFHDGRAVCTAYKARPLACRWENSYEVDGCREDHENPSLDNTIMRNQYTSMLGQTALKGMREGLRDEGLATGTISLEHGLCVTLQDPLDAAERWLEGEDVFGLSD
jgi:hypothetical protein